MKNSASTHRVHAPWHAAALAVMIAVLIAWPATTPAQGQTLPVVQFTTANSLYLEEPDTPQEVDLELTLSAASTEDVVVKYRLGTGTNTATPDEDYVAIAAGAQVTIPAGDTAGAITVTLNPDDFIEHTQYFTVKIYDPQDATLGANTQRRVNIDDSDETFPIGIAGPITVTEDVGTFEWDTRVEYTFVLKMFLLFRTATADVDVVDFEAVDVRYDPGDTTFTRTIEILDDNLVEDPETFEVILHRNSVELVINLKNWGQTSGAPVTIVDDDTTQIRFESINLRFDEPEGAGEVIDVPVKVNLTKPSSTQITVDYATSANTATRGADYHDVSGTLTFSPGTTQQEFTVPLIGDDLAESSERIRIDLSNSAGAPIATEEAQIVMDDTDPRPVITMEYPVAEEGPGAKWTVTVRSDRQAEYPYNFFLVIGHATADESDIAATIETVRMERYQTTTTHSFDILNDNRKELPETFTILLLPFGDEGDETEIHPDHANPNYAYIADDDIGKTFAVTLGDDLNKSVRKGFMRVPEGQSREYQVWMTQAPTEQVTVSHTFSGFDTSLTSNSPASHTFTPENWYEPYRVNVRAAQDGDSYDGINTIRHTVETNDSVYRKRSPKFVKAVEIDNDPDPTGWKTHDIIHGSDGIDATLHYSPDRHNGRPFYIFIEFTEPLQRGYKTLLDLATESDDARIMDARKVDGRGDLWALLIEPRMDANVVVTLVGGRECSDNTAVCSRSGKKLNNTLVLAFAGSDGSEAQLPPGMVSAAFEVTGSEGTEGDAVIEFTVSLTEAETSTVSVDFVTYDVTAKARKDFIWLHTTVTFEPGELSKVVEVELVDDNDTEGREQFNALLFNPEGAPIKTDVANAYIIDDD